MADDLRTAPPGSYAALMYELTREKNRFHWPEFVVGLAVMFVIATWIFIVHLRGCH